MKNYLFVLGLIALLFQSCATKKDILYLQDANTLEAQHIKYEAAKIQPNDILDIKVSALVPETAMPYNVQPLGNTNASNIELLKLQGYLVATDGSITFPVLGKITVTNKTTAALEQELELLLEKGGHLNQPKVSVRLLNAKVTVLGEVQRPGTYSFTEQQISLPQALGYAGDLTINGKRKDVLLIREENGQRTVTHIDLTTTDWFNSPYYYIKPNDFIVVNPNGPKVKSAGFVGNTGTLVSVLSLLLTSIVLITR
ncbi:polysaccharide export outer membrane protein [Arenibacter nanhaiticus]|uniref:Polysaccharide export outer membrane protein n=1 Tax=Arenibacter nanhaiticus TaxID=558155 RepID=A0A1M6LZC5_9FLAO|nr:polysaccharide biosynthesis/export family protein [Arenibacter nanhaiticus]SHJ76546.1 polysaccharide export outer membrane protein [Arenibacter nanhaiticus]